MNIERATRFEESVRYIHNQQHRNHNPNKSQWTITEDEEFFCFEEAADTQIYPVTQLPHPTECFGLYIKDDKATYLGTYKANSADSNRPLFLAFFEDGNANHKWHGYPVDPSKDNRFVPNDAILEKWLSSKLLRKVTVSKIRRKARCKL